MKIFKDSSGREWTLNITIDAVKRVRDLLGVNLLAPEEGEPPLLTRLSGDVILLCDVIYVLLKPQADMRDVSDIQFGESLGGDAILSATEAFFAELTDFFRGCGRTDRVRAIQAQVKLLQLAVSRAEQHIRTLDLEQKLESIFGSASINGPDSPESTPDP